MNVFSASNTGYRERALQALDRLPPFSPMLSRLLAAMAREDVSFAQLAGLIEHDTVIAAHLLRIVNSAAYGHVRTVGSIRHALTLMGLNKLRNTVFGLSMSRMWLSVRAARGWNGRAFNQHSVATAILADQLATTVPATYPEGAFVAGLLHDIGKLLIAVALPAEFARIDRLVISEPDFVAREREILGLDHAELSAAALARWNLPGEVQQAVRDHHQPDLALSGHGEHALSAIVHFADRLTYRLQPELSPANADQSAGDEAAVFEALGIADRAGEIIAGFEQEYSALRSGMSEPVRATVPA